jgi:hypothetical protein
MPSARSLALVGLLAAGCFSDPLGETSAASSAGATSDATTSTTSASAGTSSNSDSDSTSTTADTGEVASDPTTTTTTTSTTADTTDTDTSTTGDTLPPSPLVVAPEFAGCVLLSNIMVPYDGPAVCAQAAKTAGMTADDAPIAIDLELGPAMGREARAFLRFTVPQELEAATVTKATLALTVLGSSAAAGPEGDLYMVGEFTADSLENGPPEKVELLEIGSVDEPVPGGVVVRELPPSALVPGQPLLLGVFASAADSLIIHGPASGPDLAPRLTIDFE